MNVDQIRDLGRALPRFLDEFGDCFGRCDTRRYLMVYVDGQMSELHRKSVEPMALRAGVPPRSLQAFLGLLEWDEDRLVDRLQQNEQPLCFFWTVAHLTAPSDSATP